MVAWDPSPGNKVLVLGCPTFLLVESPAQTTGFNTIATVAKATRIIVHQSRPIKAP